MKRSVKIIGTRDGLPDSRVCDYDQDDDGREYVIIKNIRDASIEVESFIKQLSLARNKKS